MLGFDTSTAASAACVLRGDGEVFEHEPPPEALTARPAHAAELMPAVDRVVADAGLDFGDLDAVAVGVGPGAFTGLRIGVATARALAAAAGTELRPVSSLAALAAGIEDELRLPLIDARRGQLFAALYEGEEERWPAAASSPGGCRAARGGERIAAAGGGRRVGTIPGRPRGGGRARGSGRLPGPRGAWALHLPAGAEGAFRCPGGGTPAVPEGT